MSLLRVATCHCLQDGGKNCLDLGLAPSGHVYQGIPFVPVGAPAGGAPPRGAEPLGAPGLLGAGAQGGAGGAGAAVRRGQGVAGS